MTLRPLPVPNESANPAGVAIAGIKTLILSGLSHILFTKAESKRFASLPSAEIVNISPAEDKGGDESCCRTWEKAAIPVLEVKATAAKSSRAASERKRRIEVVVGGVTSTITVGHQRGR